MAKQTNNAPEMVEQKNAPAIIETAENLPYFQNLNALAMFAEQDEKDLIELTGGEFITLEENTTYVFLAVGFERTDSKFSKESDGKVDSAVLLDLQGNKKLCSQAVLTKTLRSFEQKGHDFAQGLPIKVITGEKVSGENGSYLSMKIYRG